MSNVELMKKGLQAWENADEATMSSLVADDFQLSGPVPQPVGKREFLGLMHIIHAAMPDFAFNISSTEEAGEAVVVRTHITGTHTGTLALPGMPPVPATGKQVKLPEEVQTGVFKNGQLQTLTTDGKPDGGIPGMLAQLGVLLPG